MGPLGLNTIPKTVVDLAPPRFWIGSEAKRAHPNIDDFRPQPGHWSLTARTLARARLGYFHRQLPHSCDIGLEPHAAPPHTDDLHRLKIHGPNHCKGAKGAELRT